MNFRTLKNISHLGKRIILIRETRNHDFGCALSAGKWIKLLLSFR